MSQLSAVLLWRGHREDLKFPASFCDPSYLLLWACAPALGELTSSGYGFSRMLASVWQSGQIHALGITLVFFEAALVKKRFYSKLLPALGNTESSNVWDNTGYWAALIPYSSGASGPRAKSPERSGTFLSFVQCFFRHLESCLTVSLTLYQETAWFIMLYFFFPVMFSSTLIPSHEFFGQVVFVLVAIPHRSQILSRKQIYLRWEMIQCVSVTTDTQSCSFCVDPVPSPFWGVVQNKEWKAWAVPPVWSLETDPGCTDSLYAVHQFPGKSIFVGFLSAHYVGNCDHLWIMVRLHFFFFYEVLN